MPYSADAAFIQEQWLGGCFPRENTLVLGSGFYCLFDLPYDCLLYTSPSPRDS